MNLLIVGSGKVGSSFAKVARQKGHTVALVSARKKLPRRSSAGVVLLAVRENVLASTVEALRAVEFHEKIIVVATLSGSASLVDLQRSGAPWKVARFHPVVSFVTKKKAPTFDGSFALVEGDHIAKKTLGSLARSLGFEVLAQDGLGTSGGYHAALAIVANGSATLAAIGKNLLEQAGVPARTSERLLGELLRSVATNVSLHGLPTALSGPVRRGDAKGAARQIEAASRVSAEKLVAELLLAQVELARAIGEATAEDLRVIARKAREISRDASLKRET